MSGRLVTPIHLAPGSLILSRRVFGPFHTTPEEFENGAFALKTHQFFFVNTRKRIKCFPSTLRQRNLKLNNHTRQKRLSAPVSMRIAKF